MEFQQILGFYHIARLKSFTRAAEATLRTQSALSQQIKSLEDELECKLLEKVGNNVIGLTNEGAALFEYAENLIKQQDNIVDKIKQIKGENIGNITVAAPVTTISYLLPKYIEQYLQLNPSVNIKLLEMTPIKCLQMVSEGEADCAITMRSAVPENFTTQNWKTSEYTLITREGHPIEKLTEVSIEDIAQYPLILPLRDMKAAPRIKLLKSFDKAGLQFRVAMEASGYSTIRQYVKLGLGVGFCLVPTELVNLGESGLYFTPVRHLFGFEPIAIALRKDKHISVQLERFFDLLFSKIN